MGDPTVAFLLAFILLLSFTMSVNERRSEFAVLRVIGYSRRGLAGLVLREALVTGLVGGLIGTVAGLLVIVPFNTLIEEQLGLPFLLPGAGTVAGNLIASVLLTAAAGAAAAGVSAFRISRIDTGLILRGGN
mgnify:CR=1 FL=1